MHLPGSITRRPHAHKLHPSCPLRHFTLRTSPASILPSFLPTHPIPPHPPALPQLRHLDLEATNLELLPPCAARLTALTALRLAFNTLRSLPPGPYLQSLLRLDLAYTSVK